TMPDMNGEEVFCRLKEINPNLKIIHSSGYHQSFLTKSFDKSQVNGYLQKPYTSEQLKLMIREAL
ncbi:MAG: response regulator, partial [Proteobacteria bacterium]|nr:response regulator [Pseudomonadota bacterium]